MVGSTYLGAPASPHIIVASNWLTITHKSKVHSRANQLSVETQIHTTHGEKSPLWYCHNGIYIPERVYEKKIRNRINTAYTNVAQ